MSDDPSQSDERRIITRRQATKASSALILQMVAQNDDKHESGHKRLRHDWRELEERIEKTEATLAQHENRLVAMATAPHDLSKLSLSPGMVASIVIGIMSIVGGQLASTWGLRSDIALLNQRMSNQSEVDKGSQTMQIERAAALKGVVDDLKKKQDLLQLEVQSLRETILNQRLTR